MDELYDFVDVLSGICHSGIVYALHFCGVHFRASYLQRFRRTQEQGVAALSFGTDIVELGIVHQVPTCHGIDDLGHLSAAESDDGHEFCAFLPESWRLCQYDDVAAVALSLPVFQGYAVGDAPVEEAAAPHLHRSGDDRERCRSAEPFQTFVVEGAEMVVYGFCGLGIGADDAEVRRVGFEGVVVEDVHLRGYVVVCIFRPHQVAGENPGAQAAVAPVVAETDVVAQGALALVRLVVATHSGTGRNADDAVEAYPVVHHHVHDAYGEQDAESASFKYQSDFHICFVEGGSFLIVSWLKSPHHILLYFIQYYYILYRFYAPT